METRIRDARSEDAACIREIYAPFVESTVTTFEIEVPSVQEMANRITSTLPTHPYLVCEDEKSGEILGYAYATKYKEREGYKWVAESSIYLATDAHGKGIGTALYEKLFDILTELGMYRVVAIIGGSNPVSHGFHRKFGFVPVEFWPNMGNKFGTWVDTMSYGKELRTAYNPNPTPPLTYLEWKAKRGN